MSLRVDLGTIAIAAALVAAGASCVVEDGPTAPSGRSGPSAAGSGASGGDNGANVGPGDAQPMLVDVDPNRTMTATPGNGAGIFTEYASGGHWHVWWTCDTSLTDQSCPFDVKISVATGALANVAGEQIGTSDQLVQPDAARLEAVTLTTSDVAGVRFDTDPKAVITLEGTISGAHDQALLFFVQDDQVRGGYKGRLTDPLMLEPRSP